jgi:hypothetical protein
MMLHALIQGQAAGPRTLIEQTRSDNHHELAREASAELDILIARLSNDLGLFRNLMAQRMSLAERPDELTAKIQRFMMTNFTGG